VSHVGHSAKKPLSSACRAALGKVVKNPKSSLCRVPTERHSAKKPLPSARSKALGKVYFLILKKSLPSARDLALGKDYFVGSKPSAAALFPLTLSISPLTHRSSPHRATRPDAASPLAARRRLTARAVPPRQSSPPGRRLAARATRLAGAAPPGRRLTAPCPSPSSSRRHGRLPSPLSLRPLLGTFGIRRSSKTGFNSVSGV
jgi:hypothetical protein